jgi:hypothetical protein
VRQVFIAPLTLLYVSLSGALGLLESSGTVSGQDVINISTVLPCARAVVQVLSKVSSVAQTGVTAPGFSGILAALEVNRQQHQRHSFFAKVVVVVTLVV